MAKSMKKRILSAAVGITFFIIIMCVYDTKILNIVVSIFSAIAIYEIFQASNSIKIVSLYVACSIYAIIAPFLLCFRSHIAMYLLAVLLFFIAFILFIKNHDRLSVYKLAFLILVTMGITYAFDLLIIIRDNFFKGHMFYILLIFGISWVCDAGAYFCGTLFGKHKLAPKISPNKTIEGAIGGVLANIVFVVLLTALFKLYLETDLQINYVGLLIFTILASVVGILGDLSASAIKRQLKIKDFGRLIPGHGGVLDRFDSFIFVSVFFSAYIHFVSIVAI